MNRKLFVDRREVLSIFGGNPGRYHGFESDLPVGGTYKETEAKLWNENKLTSDSYVAGSRLAVKRDFQAKKKVSGIVDSQLFSYSDSSNALNSSKTLMNRSPELKSSIYSRKFMGETNTYKNETKLPYLKESFNNSLIDNTSSSPYKIQVPNSKRLAYK